MSSIPIFFRWELLIAVAYVLEARLEVYVIKLKNPNLPNYPLLNKQEHAWSLVHAVFIACMVAYGSGLWVLLPSLLLSRRLFFDYMLKVFRERPLQRIEGNGWFDNQARRIFGIQNGGLWELLTVLILKFGYLIAVHKYLM
jgi:hypothetical protein